MKPGEFTVKVFGIEIKTRLNSEDIRAFEKAKRVGYLIARRRHDDSNWYLWQMWRGECAINNRPYLAVSIRGRYANIVVDLYTTETGRFSEEAFQAIEGALDAAFDSGEAVRFSCGGDTAFCRVKVDSAEQLARTLLEILERDRPNWSARAFEVEKNLSDGDTMKSEEQKSGPSPP